MHAHFAAAANYRLNTDYFMLALDTLSNVLYIVSITAQLLAVAVLVSVAD